jgi:hypothetical protein
MNEENDLPVRRPGPWPTAIETTKPRKVNLQAEPLHLEDWIVRDPVKLTPLDYRMAEFAASELRTLERLDKAKLNRIADLLLRQAAEIARLKEQPDQGPAIWWDGMDAMTLIPDNDPKWKPLYEKP